MKGWQYILVGIALCAVGAACFSIGRSCRINGLQGEVVVKTDTLLVRDTITLTRPVYVNRVKRDTVMLPVLDTAVVHDTVFVMLPVESVEWADSLCVVYASGVRVNVDSVKHYLEHRTVTVDRVRVLQNQARKRWGLGVQGGYGVGVAGGKVVGVPYVGIGVQYNIWSW